MVAVHIVVIVGREIGGSREIDNQLVGTTYLKGATVVLSGCGLSSGKTTYAITNENGVMRLTWEPVSEAADYRIQRRTGGDFNFSSYATTKYSTYPNDNVKSGYLYYYRLAAIYRDGNESYPSMTAIVYGTPQFTPQITGISASDGAVTLSWKKLTGQDHIQIWRSSSINGDYTLIDTISSSSVQYTDKTVSAGKEYFYRIVSDWTLYGYYAESDVSNTVSAKVLK